MLNREDEGESHTASPSFQLAACQAWLAFERTLISVDQALMSAVRTSLSLIGFGFALVLFFHEVSHETGVNLRMPARNFGVFLVAIGVGLLAMGLIGHRRSLAELRSRMEDLHRTHMLLQGWAYKRNPIAVLASLLLLGGLLVMAGILVRIGPFS